MTLSDPVLNRRLYRICRTAMPDEVYKIDPRFVSRKIADIISTFDPLSAALPESVESIQSAINECLAKRVRIFEVEAA